MESDMCTGDSLRGIIVVISAQHIHSYSQKINNPSEETFLRDCFPKSQTSGSSFRGIVIFSLHFKRCYMGILCLCSVFHYQVFKVIWRADAWTVALIEERDVAWLGESEGCFQHYRSKSEIKGSYQRNPDDKGSKLEQVSHSEKPTLVDP